MRLCERSWKERHDVLCLNHMDHWILFVLFLSSRRALVWVFGLFDDLDVSTIFICYLTAIYMRNGVFIFAGSSNGNRSASRPDLAAHPGCFVSPASPLVGPDYGFGNAAVGGLRTQAFNRMDFPWLRISPSGSPNQCSFGSREALKSAPRQINLLLSADDPKDQ